MSRFIGKGRMTGHRWILCPVNFLVLNLTFVQEQDKAFKGRVISNGRSKNCISRMLSSVRRGLEEQDQRRDESVKVGNVVDTIRGEENVGVDFSCFGKCPRIPVNGLDLDRRHRCTTRLVNFEIVSAVRQDFGHVVSHVDRSRCHVAGFRHREAGKAHTTS